MDYQQHSQRFPRPSADPHHQPPMRPPGAPPGPWYPGQFQYQAPPQHSPPPPPPPHSHWPPPSHSDHLPPPPYGAPPPPHPNYPGQHQPFHNQYAPPPPRPHVPPQYHPQAPQSYHQDWSNANWGHQHCQDYPGTASAVKEEDWAAKARAWAATNTGIDAQQSQVQYTSVNRLEEHSHFREQYPQAVDPRYPEALHSAFPPPGYQQSPVPAVPPYMPANILQQESGSMGSGKTSFVADEQYPYKSRDGDFAGGSTTGFSHPGNSPIMSSAHMQEVSTSYSSVTGKVETGDPAERVYKSFPSSIDPRRGLHQMHLPLPDYHRSFSVDRSHYTVNNQAAERSADLSDQPLDFAPRFHDQDPVTQSSHIRTETVGTISGLDPGAVPTHSWNPAVPGAGYPHIPQAVQSNQQFDPSAGMHSPVPGHSAPLFGRMPGPMFQPTIPSGGAPYGIGAGSGLNLASFPADVYGISGASERPKKASVPNWLKEEIIKNKAVITSSAPDRKEETESFDDENNDKTTANADQADSKSLDSSRATEEEDDDEDYVEVARTAAINQEIKRILTEVLSKVTDELFDEIATKVLSENDQQSAGVTQDFVPSSKLSPSALAARSAKPSSAKVQVPGKAKAGENQNDSGKSTSSPPGNVLRLVNYGSDGSDDDSDNDGDSDTANQLPKSRNFSNSKDKDLVQDAGKILPNGLDVHHSGVANELNGYRAGGRSSDVNVESSYSSKAVPGNIENKDTINGRNILKSADSYKHNHDWKVDTTITEALESGNTKKSGKVGSRDEETKSKHGKKDKHDTRSPSRKDTVKEENGNDQKGKRDEKRKDHEERQARKERMDDRNGSNEKKIEHGDKSGEKGKESDSRKRSSHSDVKEGVKLKERDRRDNGSRKEERHKDEKTERSRPKLASESSKHKRRRSSSVSSRGRSSRDDSVNIHANGSSDHSSDDSKRKQHSKRRYSSPSPSRSRKRQDSRSPHSKRSQRRHSPYSSLETSRGRKSRSRSRSRSPARRRR